MARVVKFILCVFYHDLKGCSVKDTTIIPAVAMWISKASAVKCSDCPRRWSFLLRTPPNPASECWASLTWRVAMQRVGMWAESPPKTHRRVAEAAEGLRCECKYDISLEGGVKAQGTQRRSSPRDHISPWLPRPDSRQETGMAGELSEPTGVRELRT